MADEEQGFTFVDKRRAAAEAPAPEVVPPSAGQAPLPTEEAREPFAPPVLDDAQAELDDAPLELDDVPQGPSDIYSVLGYCMSILASEAWQLLGLIADPQTGEARQDLAQAKVAIDAAGDLAARLEAAPGEFVPDALKRDLRTLLQDLRLNYVSQQGQAGFSQPARFDTDKLR